MNLTQSPQFYWLGEVNYRDALKIQQSFLSAEKENELPVVLGLEHPQVITLGVRGSTEDVLTAKIPVVQTERGGQATLHNPGQLVIYPLFPIKKMSLGVRNFVDEMLEITSQTLKKCNITITKKENGLFTKNGKICSAGFNIKGGKSSHGLAINVSNNLQDFANIKACGIAGAPMDKVSHYQQQLTPEDLFKLWSQEFELRHNTT